MIRSLGHAIVPTFAEVRLGAPLLPNEFLIFLEIKSSQTVKEAQAAFSSGCSVVYFVIPTMVKTFLK
jgi:hypothetical protein